jgi:hypothetical protein
MPLQPSCDRLAASAAHARQRHVGFERALLGLEASIARRAFMRAGQRLQLR